MTAIGVFWSKNQTANAAERIQQLMAPLAMYGGDRFAHWAREDIAMAIHQRYTLPEDTMDREPGLRDGIALVADLRLDNRETLCRQLGLDPGWAALEADSAILRAAWLRWREDCVHHLLGDFAFVIWDDASQTLFCARDPLGLRPLCYTTVGTRIAIASMPKGLLALPGVSNELDLDRLGRHMALFPQDPSRTFFRDVSLVPAGHTLRVTHQRFDLTQYWHPERGPSVRFRHDDDYADQFLELFNAAVQSRLRSRGPIASTLSAGLDSGTVTTLAARHLAARGERLQALTWTPYPDAHIPSSPGRLTNEGEHASAVARLHDNIDHVFVDAAARDPLTLVPRFDDACDHPSLSPITLPMFGATGDRLKALGCSVLLIGQCGNLTVSYDGLTLLPSLVRRGHLLRAARETAALARTPAWSMRTALYRTAGPFLPALARRALHRVYRKAEPSFSYCAINPDFAKANDFMGIAKRVGWEMDGTLSTNGVRLRAIGLARAELGVTFKGMQAAIGAEFRDPTADLRLVSYCFAIPEEQFLRAGQTRSLIRRAMTGLLPESTLHESRRGLQCADWPRFIAPYQAALTRELDAFEHLPVAQHVLDIPALRHLVTHWPTEWRGAEVGPYAQKLLRGLAVGHFIRRHYDTSTL